MAVRRSAPDWAKLLRGWDAQQESFNMDRERRFSAMFDVVEAQVGKRFTALDLGSGPGSLSARLLRRFPRARTVAVDYDPVALRVGEGALGSCGGRLTWVDAHLGTPGWTDKLPARKYDVALSTTALHWLEETNLRKFYRDLGRVIRRGGVFLDGDRLSWGTKHRHLSQLAESVRLVRFRGIPLDSEWAGWREWWARAERIPELAPQFRVREARMAGHPNHTDVPLDIHIQALRRAGFRETAIVWQDHENRVLYALR